MTRSVICFSLGFVLATVAGHVGGPGMSLMSVAAGLLMGMGLRFAVAYGRETPLEFAALDDGDYRVLHLIRNTRTDDGLVYLLWSEKTGGGRPILCRLPGEFDFKSETTYRKTTIEEKPALMNDAKVVLR